MNATVLAQQLLASFRDPAPATEQTTGEAMTPPPGGVHGGAGHGGLGHGGQGGETAGVSAAWPVAVPEELPAVGVDVAGARHDAVARGGLAETFARRTAARAYGAAPLDQAKLLAAVARGRAVEEAGWPQERECCPLQPLIVALRVEGLPPAIYRPDRACARLTPVVNLPEPSWYPEMVLQREFATAGAIVAIVGNVDEAVARHGGHGYRTLMARAGAAGYAIWLEAVAAGLVGCVFAGFLPAAIRLSLRCDGVSRQQLFAVALGDAPPMPPA